MGFIFAVNCFPSSRSALLWKKTFKFLFDIPRINRFSGAPSACLGTVSACRTFPFSLCYSGIILFSFCLSLRIRYASPISLNRSSALLSPGWVSGWHSFAAFLYAFLWYPHRPSAKRLIPDMDSCLSQPFFITIES